MMENNLDIILHKMRTASSEKKLKKSLENALSSLNDIRARYEFCSANLVSKVHSNLVVFRSYSCTNVKENTSPYFL